MDTSPLIIAQAHSRRAAKADSPTAAIDEHGQAAGQFAKAAKDTLNSEAFRTLKLLEQHHEKLAKIIKFRSSQPATQQQAVPDAASMSSNAVHGGTSAASAGPSKSPRHADSQSVQHVQKNARDIGSSIASDLATARGIPAHRQRRLVKASIPAVTQQNAEGKIVNPPKRSRLVESSTASQVTGDKGEKITGLLDAPSLSTKHVSEDMKEKALQPEAVKSDESFNRFYSTMESIFSRISAPLAFAGLPLHSDTDGSMSSAAAPPSNSQTVAKKPDRIHRATASPEYSRYFSPAAIRALREDVGTTGLNTAESFYVVPTTGGTMPYASILARHIQQPRGSKEPGLADADDLSDEYVDARETPGHSPRAHRKTPSVSKNRGDKTLEELELENSGLRLTCDELSRRLWKFEVSSQVTQQALNQSLRFGSKGSPAASDLGAQAGGDLEGKIRSLEKEMTSMKMENEKLRGVVGKYRERWEKLKEGARVRREGAAGMDKAEATKDES